ncbi:hypothetical protein NHX12_021666 [Muraenolepis orangiensis]|uniref:Uncharacterized protein n=1 Tax=Muraenolepis orangiensis TaxID=630683 RepID=A0A9Q0IW93_9TELE|nr:hypothetical protein NHX12_021666 [Muraenolepis orangiensis]
MCGKKSGLVGMVREKMREENCAGQLHLASRTTNGVDNQVSQDHRNGRLRAAEKVFPLRGRLLKRDPTSNPVPYPGDLELISLVLSFKATRGEAIFPPNHLSLSWASSVPPQPVVGLISPTSACRGPHQSHLSLSGPHQSHLSLSGPHQSHLSLSGLGSGLWFQSWVSI